MNPDGANLILRICAEATKELKPHDSVVLIEHRPDDTYWVVPADEFKKQRLVAHSDSSQKKPKSNEGSKI